MPDLLPARVAPPVHPSSTSAFRAGGVGRAAKAWLQVTNDPWVLGTVSGYRIPFHTPPIQHAEPRMAALSEREQHALLQELGSLAADAVIEPVGSEPVDFISPLFVVPKADGKWRVIFNLKALNQFVATDHFRMETLRDLPDMLSQGMMLCKMDLRSAYHAIPVDVRDRRYLCFRYPGTGKLWRFTCLPFGLCDAPRAFTKVLTPVVAHLRQLGLRLMSYLDDWLLVDPSRTRLTRLTRQAVQLLESLGFTVNQEKSVLQPTTRLTFLGMQVDSATMTFVWPPDKANKVQHECRRILNRGSILESELRCLLGKMEAAKFAVQVGPLHFRGLQHLLLDHWPVSVPFSTPRPVSLSPWAEADLTWWASSKVSDFWSPVRPPPLALTLATDASLHGWGAVTGQHRIGGRWHPTEAGCHINWLEMKAVKLGLEALAAAERNVTIRLEIDNVPTVAFLNRKGGTRSVQLCHLAQRVWQWATARGITLVAVHVPGKDNAIADFHSRNFQKSQSDWMLDPRLFRELNRLLGPFRTDLFAARHNCQLSQYCSWEPDPWATGIDAFSLPHLWNTGYAFPPFQLVGRCLRMVQSNAVDRLLLIAPTWPNQAWYPVLLSLLADHPIQLHSPRVVLGPNNEQHPLQVRLHLAAWPISGIPSSVVAFQKQLPTCGVRRGAHQRPGPTTVHGESGKAGVVNGRLIHFAQLQSM